jgi:hypothetical protein
MRHPRQCQDVSSHARHALQLTEKRFGVMVSHDVEPGHPGRGWVGICANGGAPRQGWQTLTPLKIWSSPPLASGLGGEGIFFHDGGHKAESARRFSRGDCGGFYGVCGGLLGVGWRWGCEISVAVWAPRPGGLSRATILAPGDGVGQRNRKCISKWNLLFEIHAAHVA